MVHLAFFDNFTIPAPSPPPPPPPYNVGSVRSKCPPWSNIVWGEGGEPSLGKRAAFIFEQGAIMKTKHIFKVYHILLTRIVVRSVPPEVRADFSATTCQVCWILVCWHVSPLGDLPGFDLPHLATNWRNIPLLRIQCNATLRLQTRVQSVAKLVTHSANCWNLLDELRTTAKKYTVSQIT